MSDDDALGVMAALGGPLNGREALDLTRATLTRYVSFPSGEAADAVTLYAAATHAARELEFATRLVIRSPEKRCGKTRLLDVLDGLVANPMVSVNISPAALVRKITPDEPPTIIIDEADALFGGRNADERTEHLRGILNAGFTRNRPYTRFDVATNRTIDIPTFSMAILAGIGHMPDTIEDRAVVVILQRRTDAEPVAKYRIRTDRPKVARVGERLSAWAAPLAKRIGDAVPGQPPGLSDRAEDAWEALLAVADLAGGDWPARARRAALVLSAESEQATTEESRRLRLLADIRTAFGGVTFLPTSGLLAALRMPADSPWGDLTPERLAGMLRRYGVRPARNPHASGSDPARVRGFTRDQFAEVFTRYLAAEVPDDE